MAEGSEGMAKRDTKAHKRHTKKTVWDDPKRVAELERIHAKGVAEGKFNAPTPLPTIGELREAFRPIPLDDTLQGLLDHAESLPASPEKRQLLAHVIAVRTAIADGDIERAARRGIDVGLVAHALGWSEKDAERYGRVKDGQDKSHLRTGKKSNDYRQKVLDQVRAQHKGWNKDAVREEAAKRCDCTPRTIVRSTVWK